MNKKAICLISGGLDSLIAIKMMQDQGVECVGINFVSPFFSNKMKDFAKNKFDFQYEEISVGEDFFSTIINPPNGHGSHMNPCIDCKIYMLKMAKSLLTKFDAGFIVTGEVLGQRPMSQQRMALARIEKQADLVGYLLRPLSALHLPITIPEQNGVVDREKLLDISGRSRKIQFDLAKKYGIEDFCTPAGGCLLAEELFAEKLKDLIENSQDAKLSDAEILKYGRHFRYKKNKIIVGRNNFENEKLIELKKEGDIVFFVPNCGSPATILQAPSDEDAIAFAASLTAFYSDAKEEVVCVEYGEPSKKIEVKQPDKSDVDKYNLSIKK
ncbi:MAG TPA: tRNA 4-thiouridine(8) synthase ThiI [Spirochaetota bacterium]|nr:tRNA 4-thiouridine(8) synthase ThiI [Spirochaetota bacterium]